MISSSDKWDDLVTEQTEIKKIFKKVKIIKMYNVL